MKATVESINSVQRRVKVELSLDDVTLAFNNAFAKIQKKASVRGFRPGKVPLTLIKKLYGQSVAIDVADDLVRRNLFVAIEQENLRPVSPPVLETASLPEAGKEYAFSALVDIMPKLSIEGYKGLNLAYRPLKLSDDTVALELGKLQRRSAKSKSLDADASAAKGHLAIISHTVTRDGIELKEFDVKELEVEIGKGELWHELEDALVGMKQGMSKTIAVTLPAEYPDEDLRNVSLSYDIKLDALKDLILPPLDDEFAKDLGLESLAVLKDNLSEQLKQRVETDKHRQLESALLENLGAKNPFDVPPSLVDQVIDSMIDEMNWRNDKQRAEAKHNQELRQSLRDGAKQKACNTLLLHEVIMAEKIEVTDDDVDTQVKNMLSNGGASMPDDPQLFERLRKNLAPQIKNNLLFTKAIDFVIAAATVSEITD